MTVNEVRRAIIDASPSETSLSGADPNPEWVYLPLSHAKALRIETSLVLGSRGVGKSFWWTALQSEAVRKALAVYLPDLSGLTVAAGYGEKPNIKSYPDAGTLQMLIDQGHEPMDVWRAVAVRWIARIRNLPEPAESWEMTVIRVKNDPESLAKNMESADAFCGEHKEQGLILFDALDRTGPDWRTMDRIVKDLLRFVLYIKPFRNLHAKVFLRNDQLEGRDVKVFPDASKLLSTRVELFWGLLDLHGLLWQYFINAPGEGGEIMRMILQEASGLKAVEQGGVYHLPEELRRDEDRQRTSFEELAGRWMGKDPRRGRPYTWSVSHLADGHGRVSPRSFIAAILSAAEDGMKRYPDHDRPLHYESIKRGVQKASEIRIS
ncbi:MAG: hypothetical protein V2B18_22565, partial [Pseudomonadota bacterium]